MHTERSFPPLVDQCWFLAGPTASGKSAVSLELAGLIEGEILSLDSIAVYQGMDIGTAKPSPEEQQRVPHHLLDLAPPDEDFSVSRFLENAHRAVVDILSRGRTPIFVGGTPLYMKGLLRGFYVGPPADWEFRRQVEADLAQHGNEALHRRLQQVDPLTAHRLPPSDVRRITRALEVIRATGVPLSHQQLQFDSSRRAHECRVFALNLPRPLLAQRIDERTEQMFSRGLVEEVRRLGPLGRTAAQAVGYREVLLYLSGKLSLEEAVAQVKLHTRQMAKRQLTWLRSLSEIRFVDVSPSDSAREIAQRIFAAAAENR
jgi:tRNA dimethylallyltransferase